MTPPPSSSSPDARTPAAGSVERRRDVAPEELLRRSRRGDRVALARLLSAVERGGVQGRAAASLAYRSHDEARTVGITGPPGAGKSTLVDRLIAIVRQTNLSQVAVLAVDPSSPFTGGAILGDRVRMQDHALDDAVFIRSMASRGHLGGLALAVPESIRVLGAAGFPLVLIETVGVGQVEVEAAEATDTTVVVLNPKWGDAVQANKAGLLETADIFVVNKADMPGARDARRDLEQMLDLSAPSAWRPPVIETAAANGEGVEALWDEIERHQHHLDEHGTLERSRAERLVREFRLVLAARLEQEIDDLCAVPPFADLVQAVTEHRLDPYDAAERFLDHARFGSNRSADGTPDDEGRGRARTRRGGRRSG